MKFAYVGDPHREDTDLDTTMAFVLNGNTYPLYRSLKRRQCPWKWNDLFPCAQGTHGGTHAIVYVGPNLYFRGPAELMVMA
jgi:hypothetical protein